MKHIAGLILSTLLLAPFAGIAGTIQYSVTDAGVTSTGDPVSRFTYTFPGITLEAYQEIEIRFSPADFVSIFNPVGNGPDIDVITLQVNNPPGAAGTYSLVSLTDNPPLSGIFSVDAVLSGNPPATLPYFINQLEPGTFAFLERISSGSAQNTEPIPEPASAGYVVIGIAMAGLLGLLRRYRSAKGLANNNG